LNKLPSELLSKQVDRYEKYALDRNPYIAQTSSGKKDAYEHALEIARDFEEDVRSRLSIHLSWMRIHADFKFISSHLEEVFKATGLVRVEPIVAI
jgi:hypothetical protein